jgi:hypothetical protein
MNSWVSFVKEFSKKNNLSYGCAITNADCKSEYYKKKDFTKNKLKQHKENIVSMNSKLNKKIVETQLKETSGMQGEDINVNPPPVKTMRLKVKKMTPNNAMKNNKKKLENQLVETMGMMKEDVDAVDKPKMMKLRVKKKKMIILPEPTPEVVEEVKKKGRGRPVKYSTIEEKKAMKLKQTLASNKKKREEKKNKVTVI